MGFKVGLRMRENIMNNRRLKLIAGALKLTRRDIANIVTLGGVEISNSLADGWLRSESAQKHPTGNSSSNTPLARSREMGDKEFDAFCRGLKPWMENQEQQ